MNTLQYVHTQYLCMLVQATAGTCTCTCTCSCCRFYIHVLPSTCTQKQHMVLECGICHPTHDALCVCTCIFTPTCVPVLHVHVCVHTNVHHLYTHMCPCTHVYVHILQIVRMTCTSVPAYGWQPGQIELHVHVHCRCIIPPRE